jgi:hypothetical protein
MNAAHGFGVEAAPSPKLKDFFVSLSHTSRKVYFYFDGWFRRAPAGPGEAMRRL